MAINQRYDELKAMSEMETLFARHRKERDYNRLVQDLNDDAEKEAHASYLLRLKKQADNERRLLKRELRGEVRKRKSKNNKIESAPQEILFFGKGSSFGEMKNIGQSNITGSVRSIDI